MKTLSLFGVALVAAFGMAHVAGLREDACFLSGSPAASLAGGLAYVGAYFGAVVIAPIFFLSALLLTVSKRAQAKMKDRR